MDEKLLKQFDLFRERTGDSVSAAILTLAPTLACDRGKRTGLTYQDAAEFLGVSVTSVKKIVSEGILKPVRVGRSIRFNVEDLEDFQRRRLPTKAVHPSSHLRHFQRPKCQTT